MTVVVSQTLKYSLVWGLTLLVPLAGCDRAAQQAFSADPNTSRWSNAQGQLPADFPTELRYPSAQLHAARSDTRQANQGQAIKTVLYQTRWLSSTSGQSVQTFYRQVFQRPGWKLLGQDANQDQTVMRAQNQNLNVTVTIPNRLTTVVPQNPQSNNPAAPTSTITVPVTSFTIEYYRTPPNAPSASPSPSSGQPKLVGPTPPTPPTPDPSPSVTDDQPTAIAFADLDQAPGEFQPYLQDLAQLGVLSPAAASDETPQSDRLQPNQTIQRGTFARWLVQANNRLYGDRPTRQIRLATDTAQPAFKDVPTTHPDFPYIQGLAEAGYLPSPLSGDQDQILFRPRPTPHPRDPPHLEGPRRSPPNFTHRHHRQSQTSVGVQRCQSH